MSDHPWLKYRIQAKAEEADLYKNGGKMSDDLVRYRQEEVHLGGGDVEYRYVESKDGWIASYADAKAALDAQAAEIARLRARVVELEGALNDLLRAVTGGKDE